MTLIKVLIALCVCVGVGLAIYVLYCMFLIDPKEKEDHVEIHASPGAIVTVRKIGPATRIDVRREKDEDWMSEPLSIDPIPIEATRNAYPELYDEYMADETSAIRKYEIIDIIYSFGFTLPAIPGLQQLWKKEQEELRKSEPAAVEGARTEPVRIAPQGVEIKTLGPLKEVGDNFSGQEDTSTENQ